MRTHGRRHAMLIYLSCAQIFNDRSEMHYIYLKKKMQELLRVTKTLLPYIMQV